MVVWFYFVNVLNVTFDGAWSTRGNSKPNLAIKPEIPDLEFYVNLEK